MFILQQVAALQILSKTPDFSILLQMDDSLRNN